MAAGIVSDLDIAEVLRAKAHRINGDPADLDVLVTELAQSRLVLLGEASHGTHEFYELRGEITRRLIRQHGFNAVAVEADWPDAYRVNRFVRGRGSDANADEALSDFKRFPAWMWRNRDVLEFVGWLREHNEVRPRERQAGFYGIDLYSLNTSIAAVLSYLEEVDPDAARRARARYSCFDHFGEDTQAYGYAATVGLTEPCERAVVSQLLELRKRQGEMMRRDGAKAEEEFFFVEQNARLVRNAEEYYRSMYQGSVESWNLRDRHMVETLEELVKFLGRNGRPPRVVLWAHNSHLGDARATQMALRGEWNVGQLVRERFPGESRLVGFTTFEGSVTAASAWDSPAERKRVRPALENSFERLFHETEINNFYLMLGDPGLSRGFRRERLERAIGVIYLPKSERLSHYFDADLPRQFDAVIHVDRTRALEPLEPGDEWTAGEAPETFPTGM